MKVLVISNNCLSNGNSNGRTLLNLLGAFCADQIYQIYTSNEVSDKNFACKSLQITNSEVALSYLGITRPTTKKVEPCLENKKKEIPRNLTGLKSAFSMLLRDILWDYSPMVFKRTKQFVQDVKPDLIILQLADCTLTIKIAIRIAKLYSIPIITFNTEDYYFKEYNYMKKKLYADFMYRIFHNRFKKAFNDLMSKYVVASVYNCDGLANLYKEVFSNTSYVVHCASKLIAPSAKYEGNFQIVYSGNLSLGRDKELIKIAKKLQKINTNLTIDIYGNASEATKSEFATQSNINYKGFVSYEENVKAITNAQLLLHVDCFDEFHQIDSCFAFSTKLADYCMTGVPIFIYSPAKIESTKYFTQNDAAFVVTDESKLTDILTSALYNEEARSRIKTNALRLGEFNHEYSKAAVKFRDIIMHYRHK